MARVRRAEGRSCPLCRGTSAGTSGRPNGTADPSFGTGGFARPFAGQDGSAHDTFVRPDGRIMVAGRVNFVITTVRVLP